MLTTMYWWVPYCPIAERAGKMGGRQPRVNSCVLSHWLFRLILATISASDDDCPPRSSYSLAKYAPGKVSVVSICKSDIPQSVQTHQRRKHGWMFKVHLFGLIAFSRSVKKKVLQKVMHSLVSYGTSCCCPWELVPAGVIVHLPSFGIINTCKY